LIREAQMPLGLETALYWVWTVVCVVCGFKGYAPWPVLLVCALAGTVLVTLTMPKFVRRLARWPGHVTLYAVLYLMAGVLYLFGSLLALGFKALQT